MITLMPYDLIMFTLACCQLIIMYIYFYIGKQRLVTIQFLGFVFIIILWFLN